MFFQVFISFILVSLHKNAKWIFCAGVVPQVLSIFYERKENPLLLGRDEWDRPGIKVYENAQYFQESKVYGAGKEYFRVSS